MGTITSKSDSVDEFPWLSSMLQTVDPLFPIGSYAHSYGLEEMVASGIVTTEEQLSFYLQSVVQLNLSQFELPYLRYTYRAQQEGCISDIARIDDEIGASLLSSEIRSASAAQGKQRLQLLNKLWPCKETALLEDLRVSGEIVPHHLTAFAAERIHQATPLKATLVSWAYQGLAAPCSAALKIMRIGQEAAQRTLTRALDTLPELVEDSLNVEREWAGAFNPVIDIASARHERAFARLFIS